MNYSTIQRICVNFTNKDIISLTLHESSFSEFKKGLFYYELLYAGYRAFTETQHDHWEVMFPEYFSADNHELAVKAFLIRAANQSFLETGLGQRLKDILESKHE